MSKSGVAARDKPLDRARERVRAGLVEHIHPQRKRDRPPRGEIRRETLESSCLLADVGEDFLRGFEHAVEDSLHVAVDRR